MSKKTQGVKSAPKKTRKKKSSEEAAHDGSHKTPQVMKLLEQNKSASNPVILAGKSRIPRQLSGREPLSRIMKREMSGDFFDVEDTVVVNLTQLAIENEAPAILDRFNACSCEKCVEVFSAAISQRIPARFARISKTAQRRGSHELTERLEPSRKAVISEMIRELIGNKKRCFHNE